MEKLRLPNVTLLGIDCVEVERLQKALDICESGIEFAETKLLTSLPTADNRKVEIKPINSVESYSEFCIRNLTEYVETDFVLVAQHDGFVLHPDAWEDEFLNYDYIGAPWLIQANYWFEKIGLPRSLEGKWLVGNGGFSLRSKRFLNLSRDLAEEGVFEVFQPEDLRLCVFERGYFASAGMMYAPPEVAKRFSAEGRYVTVDNQFGFHGLKWTDI